MSGWISSRTALVALTAGVLGWTLHAELRELQTDKAVPPPTPMPATDTVTVLPNGSVSIHVQEASLAWVLHALEQQGAAFPLAETRTPDRAPSSSIPVSRPQTGSARDLHRRADPTPNNTTVGADEPVQRLARTLQRGADASASELRDIYENDPSDERRLIAFSAYLDLISGDAGALRATLEHQLSNGSSAVREDAHKRLDQLHNFESEQLMTPPQGDQ